ncbi:MAG: aspartate carbamoyltransferase regulatory subunit [Candidatus Hydrothermarchaeota archaeon]|nr:aspartate carbamoyltransferase regulatory subunit [Candidatus Hydrothermarchaeota archaeon]
MTSDIRVKKIKNGTVIDHIPSGQALNVLKILGITKDYPKTTVTVAMNVPSRKADFKDIVKVEGKELDAEELDKIALIASDATINIIRNYDVVEKKRASFPDAIEGVLRCGNSNCITNYENMGSKFSIENKTPIKLRCIYCERSITEDEVVRQF